jgi:hypothetical protein
MVGVVVAVVVVKVMYSAILSSWLRKSCGAAAVTVSG